MLQFYNNCINELVFKVMIYDCFTFFNELDLLELRLNILNEVVDKFVIVESSKTFSRQDKPMNFKDNFSRFEKYKDKIIYIEFNDFPNSDNPWVLENTQRNAISLGLKDCKDDDIIIISDIDEIVSPNAITEGIKTINQGTPIKKFVQYNMRYYLNVINCNEPLWFHPEMCTYKNFKNCLDNVEYNYNTFTVKEYNKGTTANKIRMYEQCDLIPLGGWHFSFMGGAKKVLYKYENYAHQEVMANIDSVMQNLIKEINNIDTQNSLSSYKAIDYSILPVYLQENIDKYKEHISKTPLENLVKFNSIDSIQYKEIKKKFFRYAFLHIFSIGKARKRYNRKYFYLKEQYKALKYYLSK